MANDYVTTVQIGDGSEFDVHDANAIHTDNIHISASEPTSSEGVDGDIWFIIKTI